jgi:hypothetical protein
MKKHKSIAPYFVIILLLLSNCKENPKKKEANSNTEKQIEVNLNSVNEASIIKEDNIFVVNQTFSKENNEHNIVGKPVEVDLALTSGAMISAYSEYNDDYTISFRTFENNSWSDWVELKENEEVKNPNRKVFSPKNLKNSVKEIQFKSNKVTKSKVIFRIYTFQKQ